MLGMGTIEVVCKDLPEVKALIAELRADALRYRYVRDELSIAYSPHMDGTSCYRIIPPFGRGRTLDEVIDQLIAETEGGTPTAEPLGGTGTASTE